MKVIIAHNYYQQPGGEDQVFLSESKLLERYGNRVIRYTMHNDYIANMDPIKVAINTLWNKNTTISLRNLIRYYSPEIIHFHNTFPLISPGSYYAKSKKGPALVQTLHNFRILCPGAFFLRNGHICEKCLHKIVPWPGAVEICYRKNFPASVVTVAMIALHKLLRTWQKKIDRYIALTEFAKDKFIRGGIPSHKIVVKPNFVSLDPGYDNYRENYALFVGRLSIEKGIVTLINAWKNIDSLCLKIAGHGPLVEVIKENLSRCATGNVKILGQLYQNNIIELMKKAKFLIFPSRWYEGFPNTLAEALACGLPVITSKLGSMAEIIQDGVTGLHFEAGNPVDLEKKIKWLIEHPKKCHQMGKNARQAYLDKYTCENNYDALMNIYQEAIAEFH